MSLSNFDVHYTPGIDAGSVREALSHFQTLHGRLPHALEVHPASVPLAELALTHLGQDLPVRSNGGALWGEIWLQTNSEEKTRA